MEAKRNITLLERQIDELQEADKAIELLYIADRISMDIRLFFVKVIRDEINTKIDAIQQCQPYGEN